MLTQEKYNQKLENKKRQVQNNTVWKAFDCKDRRSKAEKDYGAITNLAKRKKL